MKKRTDARWMLVASMAIFGTLGVFVRNIENTAGADLIKLMVFDNLYNIKPLCIFDEVASGI